MYLRIDFPTGQYHAAEAHAPSYPEWPPHPSRIFSGLVAAAYSSPDGISEQKRQALKWLEALPSPAIAAPKAYLSASPVTYVPPGDILGRKGKRGAEVYEHGVHRWRQPRYFPCAIILDKPTAYIGWDIDPDAEILSALEKIASNVTHVGTSHTMSVVSAHLGKMPKKATLLPDKVGTKFMRVPASGRLDELDAVYKNKTGVRRPPAACESFVAYKDVSAPLESKAASAYEFMSLRVAGTMHGADTAAYLGKSLRRAVMSVLSDQAPAAVHGHNGGIHVGWLPLPDVGHRYATGRIVGIAVAVPMNLEPEQRQQVLSGISRINELYLPDGRTAKLSPTVPGERVAQALRKQTWVAPSSIWSTVTPVVLDRPPKRLDEKRLTRAMTQSLVFAGYPKPNKVEISAFSRFKGAPPAFTVPAAKPRYHATVCFDEPVAGPMMAGRLRYFGIGLFRPITAPDSGEMV